MKTSAFLIMNHKKGISVTALPIAPLCASDMADTLKKSDPNFTVNDMGDNNGMHTIAVWKDDVCFLFVDAMVEIKGAFVAASIRKVMDEIMGATHAGTDAVN